MNKLSILLSAAVWIPTAAVADIPPNTWVRLTPDPCTGRLCSSDFPEKRGYSGTAIGNGYIWYWGGGHKAGPFNDIDAYNISENEWEQLTTAEDIREHPNWNHLTDADKEQIANRWGGGGPTSLLSPLGRSLTAHDYDRMAWWPDTREYCMINGWGHPQRPALWCYDPEKGDESGEPAASGHDPTQPDGAWRVEGVLPTDKWSHVYHTYGLTYDARRGQLVAVRVSGRDRLWRYENGEWKTLTASFAKGDDWNEGNIDYIPPLDSYIVSLKQNMQLVDAETGEVTVISQPPINQRSFSYEYSPELNTIIVADDIDGVPRLFAYDAENDGWRELHIGGQVPVGAHLGQDLLDRDPGTGQYYLVYREPGGGTHIPGWVHTFRLTPEALDNTPADCPVDLCVGSGFAYRSIQNAVNDADAGDTIGLAEGDYEQCIDIDRPVTIRPISGRPHVRDRICLGKAVIVSSAAGTTVLQGLEVSGGTDVKGIWHENGAGTLIIRDLVIHDSGMGILAGDDSQSLQVHDSEIHSIDDPNELAHFIYGAEVRELVLVGNRFHGGSDGHLIKAQSIDVEIRDNDIIQERFTDINLIDVWGCGDNVITGNTIRSADTPEAVIAIGITTRKGGDVPCPVDRFSFRAEGNRYEKLGERKWSAFINNRYTENLPTRDLIVRDNEVINAWLVKGKDRNYSQQEWKEVHGSDGSAGVD